MPVAPPPPVWASIFIYFHFKLVKYGGECAGRSSTEGDEQDDGLTSGLLVVWAKNRKKRKKNDDGLSTRATAKCKLYAYTITTDHPSLVTPLRSASMAEHSVNPNEGVAYMWRLGGPPMHIQ